MKTVVGFLAALVVIVIPNIVDALNSSATSQVFDISPTNYPVGGFAPTNLPAASALPGIPAMGTNPIISVLEMREVPIHNAIQNLARQASINCLIAPQLEKRWTDFEEPLVSFKLKNIKASDVLEQMLNLRHLTLVKDPASNIAFVIPANEIGNPLFSGLPTNSAALHTNLIPLIQFSDVPISTAIENLARQEEVNYILTPKVARLWDGSGTPDPVPEPQMTLRFERVTCWSALNRMLNIRGLVLVEDPATRVARIAFGGAALPTMDASLLDTGTNGPSPNAQLVVPVIQFSDVPLDTALENLIKQCDLDVKLDPLLKGYSDPQNQPPLLTLRWTDLTAKQALVALCENYDLIITKNNVTGIIQIKPGKIKKRPLPQSQ